MNFTKIKLLRLCDKAAGSIPALSIVVILNLSTTKNNTKLGRAWCCNGGGDGGRWC